MYTRFGPVRAGGSVGGECGFPGKVGVARGRARTLEALLGCRGDVAMVRAWHSHVLYRRFCGPSWGEPEVRDRGGGGVWGVSGCSCWCAGGLPATGD